MDSDRLSRLTEAQRECLRLVHQHKTTAEIAHILGLAGVTVNKRIDRARHKLGGISRGQAAQLLAAAESLPPYDKIIRRKISLPGDGRPAILPLVDQVEAPGWNSGAEINRAARRVFPWPFRTRERPTNDLSIGARLLQSLGLTGALATAAALISIAVLLLMRFLIDISRHGG